jgi:tripartite ATP-independent transporter DctP family solute receptor
MKKNLMSFFAFTMIVLIFLTACSDSTSTNTEDDIDIEEKVMKVSHNQQPTHPVHVALESFKKEVEEKTNGSVIVDLYPSATLGDDQTNLDQVSLGSIQAGITMGSLANLVVGTDDPRALFEELPFMFPDAEAARKAWDGPLGEQYKELGREHGLEVLCHWENGFRNMTNNIRPIVIPKDMEGIKFRIAPSEMRQLLFKELNATAIPMAFPELFTGLQQGTVDGQENPLSIIETSKFYEVQKYLSLSRHIYNTATFYVNPDWFNSLTAEEQEIIQEASEKARDYMRELNDEFEATSIKTLEDNGMEVNEIDREAFVTAAEPVWEYYVSNYEGGQELIDMAQ